MEKDLEINSTLTHTYSFTLFLFCSLSVLNCLYCTIVFCLTSSASFIDNHNHSSTSQWADPVSSTSVLTCCWSTCPPPWQLLFRKAFSRESSHRELDRHHDLKVDACIRITDIKVVMMPACDNSSPSFLGRCLSLPPSSLGQYATLWSRRPLHRSLSEVWADGGQRLFQYPFSKSITVPRGPFITRDVAPLLCQSISATDTHSTVFCTMKVNLVAPQSTSSCISHIPNSQCHTLVAELS